ncbi:MAG: hypothetical protein NWE83_08060 [Candidatus Bathyarchaeota archaeon]|nr:hypothetical protein [Candidatus Bathyarchaeota archaeon]
MSCVFAVVVPNIDWMQFVNRYYESYLKQCPLNQTRIEYYQAYRCIRLILVMEVYDINVAGKRTQIEKRLIHRFHEITGIELEPSTE